MAGKSVKSRGRKRRRRRGGSGTIETDWRCSVPCNQRTGRCVFAPLRLVQTSWSRRGAAKRVQGGDPPTAGKPEEQREAARAKGLEGKFQVSRSAGRFRPPEESEAVRVWPGRKVSQGARRFGRRRFLKKGRVCAGVSICPPPAPSENSAKLVGVSGVVARETTEEEAACDFRNDFRRLLSGQRFWVGGWRVTCCRLLRSGQESIKPL